MRILSSQPLRFIARLPVQRSLAPALFPSAIRMSSSSSSTAAASASTLISAGEDVPTVQRAVEALIANGWGLDDEKMGIKKTYYFKGYFKAVSFLNMIAAESAAKKHHAVMTVRIGSVDVHWTTHNPRGLSQKDITMAQHCDRGAELMGSVNQEMGIKCG